VSVVRDFCVIYFLVVVRSFFSFSRSLQVADCN